ncbi:MAG: efflux RND transporter periplasmic adaptor subunit [Lachnospiraceae bacterium]|nr:efflux RND transporter periplasmic adaptor subunit [Lachnospiraceae bacterium]
MKHKKLVIGTCIVLAAAVGGLSVTASAGTAIKTATASTGQLDCELELNGKVESLNERSYFSIVDGRIGNVHVKEGDLVKKGDILISYDMEEITLAKALTELDVRADQGGYDDSKQSKGRVAGLYGEAKNSLAELEQQIVTTEAVIITTQKALTDRQSELSERGAQLQADLACCNVGEGDDPNDVQRARDNIQKEIAKNQYDQQYDPDIVRKQEELQFLNYLMTSYKEKKSVMESQKAATQLNLQTEGGKEQLEAVKEADDLINESKLKDYAEASAGITADFDGVVTKLCVSEGSSVSEGQELIQIRSLENVAVVCYVNKYDIINIEEGQAASAHIKNRDYSCHVSRIEKMTSDDGATPGIRVELTIDDADDSIILGIESKTKVQTAMLAYALLIPVDSVCEDDEGEYVFVIKDGKAFRRSIVTGVRNDEMAEVCEGLQAGETIGWDEMSELTDGQKVKVK